MCEGFQWHCVVLDAVQELGMQPYVLLWLRYTAFLVLYPLGVSSELASVALALPTIRATRPWSIEVWPTGCH
jgi:very-long-chain (3R)-3-hydroxyacyl-CoA dehydratase